MNAIRFLLGLTVAIGSLSRFSNAQQSSTAEESLSAAAHEYFTDVQLTTQNGQSVRLYSDLLQRKVVVINSFFAECADCCPIMFHALSDLQALLGDHLGKDVFLLSFSVDPKKDTPEKLKEYAARFHAKRGWLFLTGEKESVDFALANSWGSASRLGNTISRVS